MPLLHSALPVHHAGLAENKQGSKRSFLCGSRHTELQGEVHKLIAATRFQVVTQKLHCRTWLPPSMP
jgi:hypothetical protein